MKTGICALLEKAPDTKIKFIQMDKLIRYIIASCLWTWCFTLLGPGVAQAQSSLGFSIEGTTVVEKDTFTVAVKAMGNPDLQ